MQNLLSGFASLHALAHKRGDGLHPKLLEFAQRDSRLVQQGVLPLEVEAVSSGPSQPATVVESGNVHVMRSKGRFTPSEKAS